MTIKVLWFITTGLIISVLGLVVSILLGVVLGSTEAGLVLTGGMVIMTIVYVILAILS